MNSQSAQSILSLLTLALFASIVSFLFYLPLRLFEGRFRIACGVFSSFICVWLLIVANSRHFLFEYFVALFFGLIGAIFHRKSRIKSTGFLSSFILMAAVSVTANFMFATAIQYNTLSVRDLNMKSAVFLIGFPPPYIATIVQMPFFFIVAQSITPPLFVWMWKKYRFRPGVDKHLDS